MNGLWNGLVSVLLCAIAIECAGQSEPNGSQETERDPGSRNASDTQSLNAEATRPQETSEAQVIVYFGSFRDRLAAAKYREHLHSMGLLRVNIRTAKVGVEMLVTDPMERGAAQELAESLGGRVLSVDWLHRTTKDYGLLPQ